MAPASLLTSGLKKRLRAGLNRVVAQKWLNIGLRTKMGAIVVIGLVGLLTIFALLGLSTTRQATDQVLSERLMLARLSAANLDSTIRHIESMLTIIADHEVFQNRQADPTAQMAALQAGFKQIALFGQGIYLLDETGQPLAAAPDKIIGVDWPAISAVQSALHNRPFGLAMAPGNRPWAIIAVPVHSKTGRPVGALAALLDLTNPAISPFRNPFELGLTGIFDVVDQHGQVLISANQERILKNSGQDELLYHLFRVGQPVVETCIACPANPPSAPEDLVIAFAPMSEAPWGVVIRQQSNEVFAPVRRLTLQTLVLGLAALLGATGLVWVTTSSVINPMQILIDAAKRIASGDLSTPICCERGDEIGALAHSFDAMRVQLKYSLDEVQTWNRELDARVQERTEAALVAQLEAQLARDDLRAIIDGLNDQLIVIDLNHRIQQVNKAARLHCGEHQEPIGRLCYQLFHGGKKCRSPQCECPMSAVLTSGESVKVTHIHPDPSTGQKRYVDIVASPMYDSSGQITRIIELMRDVTDEKQLADSLVRRNQQLSILNAVATTVNQSLDLEQLLGQTLDELLRLTEIDVGAVFLYTETLGSLELLAHQGLSEEAAHLAARLGMLDGSCGGVMETGQIIVVPDLSRYRGRRAASLQREKLHTLVHIPLVAKGCKLGSICVGTRNRREFDEEDQELLTALGNQMAVAVENARLYAEVQHKEQLRGELLNKVINAQEDERKRIARELHDETSQTLAALLYKVEETMELDRNDQAEVDVKLTRMHNLVTHTLDGVHKLIFALRPTMLDHLGLVPAIRWFAQSRLEPTGIQVTITETTTGHRLPAEVETALFRVVQEAINNIARHSGARNVKILFHLEAETTTINVEDDGLGFDMVEVTLSPNTRRGLGLLGMQERIELLGGSMEISTAPGYGTSLCMHIPNQKQGAGYG